MLSIFSCSYWPSTFLFEKRLFSASAQFLIGLFFCCWVVSVCIWKLNLSVALFANIFDNFLRELTWGILIPYSGAGAGPSENLSFGSQYFYLLNTLSALPLPSSLDMVFGDLTQSYFISPKWNQYSYHTSFSHFVISFLYTTQLINLNTTSNFLYI